MSNKRKRVLDIFTSIIPKLSDADIEKLLAFGDGVAIMAERKQASS